MIAKRFNSTAALKKTALYNLHVSMGGTMVPFAGYSMPVKYAGMTHIESHKWTRQHAGLFDVSHMLQSTLRGADAVSFLHKITPTDFQNLPVGTSSLSVLLNERGGIVDDTMVTKTGASEFYIVTNAACAAKDTQFLQDQISGFDCQWQPIENRSLLALQGPDACKVFGSLIKGGPEALKDLYFGERRPFELTDGVQVQAARSGYTGEDGFEISVVDSSAELLGKLLLDNSLARPIGLAARDSLRLEAGMCLYGNELNDGTTPIDTSLGWLVSKTRRDGSLGKFNGFEPIMKQIQDKSNSVVRVGFKYTGKGPAARTGTPLLSEDGSTAVGHVTSGSASPSLGGVNIGQASVLKVARKAGTKLLVSVRNKVFPVEVARLPLVPSHYYKK
ncbi:LAMI_0C06106g1_1 [Lachancea mirantina]|uniref:Aminomethyltransferase n=1 Tax=Lachancea mirantina TaxID=1230905 RepID=A0A1G4J330_9SACH|nr:LAMI_0C06106g1_1 [Lachancea mirantina]